LQRKVPVMIAQMKLRKPLAKTSHGIEVRMNEVKKTTWSYERVRP